MYVQDACQWIIPSYLKTVEYLPVKEIDFTSAKEKRENWMNSLIVIHIQQIHSPHVTKVFTARGKKPTESEMDLLFENLSCTGTKPAILSLIPKFSDSVPI